MYLISYNNHRAYLIHRKEINMEQILKKEFKIYEVYNGKKTIPQIRINGIWLQELGFNIGDKISLELFEGKLVIDKMPAEETKQTKKK